MVIDGPFVERFSEDMLKELSVCMRLPYRAVGVVWATNEWDNGGLRYFKEAGLETLEDSQLQKR